VANAPPTHLNIRDVLIFSQAKTTITLLAEKVHTTTHWCLIQNAQVFLHATHSVLLRISSLTLAKGTNLHFLPGPGVSITLEWCLSDKAFLPATFGSDSIQEHVLLQEWTNLLSARYALAQVTYRLSRYVRTRKPGVPTDTQSAPLLKDRLDAQEVLAALLLSWNSKVGPNKKVVTFLSMILGKQM
jgi:hypothetical protein